MNFLAHIFLSGKDNSVTIGNFIGDFVKGNQFNNFEEQIQKGILLHRSIDHFTDNHDTVRKSKKRLQPTYRHYAPVIIDLYYDHFLAASWSRFSDEPLDLFVLRFYQLTASYKEIIPTRANKMLQYMIRDNWLFEYQFIEGIGKALSGLARRTTYESKMESADVELKENYDLFRHEFLEFFPELQAHAIDFLNSSK